jgi:hypothetical protein
MPIITELTGGKFWHENSFSNVSKSEIGVEALRKGAKDPSLFREDSFS